MSDLGHLSVVSTAKKDHVVPVTLLSADQDGPTNVLRLQPKVVFFYPFLIMLWIFPFYLMYKSR